MCTVLFPCLPAVPPVCVVTLNSPDCGLGRTGVGIERSDLIITGADLQLVTGVSANLMAPYDQAGV